MSRRAVCWLVGIIVAVHIVFFIFISRLPALPKARYVPPPNFHYEEQVYKDPKTGEKTIYREIRVSTKLANREKLPPSPKPKPPASPSPAPEAATPARQP